MGVPGEVHRSDVVACLALASDLGMGQPLEQALRTCLLSMRVGRHLDLPRDELANAYYIALLRFVGCNSHAHQDAVETGDEIAFRSGVAPVLSGGNAEMLRFIVTRMSEDAPPLVRVRRVAGALAAGPKGGREAIAATCEVAQMLAARLEMSPEVVNGLAYTFEYYDGSGSPQGAAGPQIPAPAHLVMIARDFEVLHRLGGRDLILQAAAKRRGRAYDPAMLDVFLEHAWGFLEAEEAGSTWDAVIAADPWPQALAPAQFDEALECLADFCDIRSPFTHGYSNAVADLAVRAAEGVGIDADQIRILGAAGRVQELGMTSVPMSVLSKSTNLTDGEWERVRLHPYLTERILCRCPALSPIGRLASTHHERMDGSGYHRGSLGSQLTVPARLLAVAGAYVAMTAERPWRPALSPRRAAAELGELVQSGSLDRDAADAVLGAVGQPAPARRRDRPAGLTDREVQVLRLIARGNTNRRVADRLVISVKTVGRHIENIYAKTGVTTRAGAATFALQHGLTSSVDPEEA